MNKKEVTEARGQLVRKANDLIQKSRFNLSLQQQKIILFIISRIQPYDEEFKEYVFPIQEFCQVVGIDYTSGNNYNDLKEQIKTISDKSLWITSADGNTESLIRWVEMPVITKNSGLISFRLNEALKPYLLQLKANYTEYELIYCLYFRSKYSIRLFELIHSIHYNTQEQYEREYTVESLKGLLAATTYKNFKDFHTRALKPAVKEINQYSDKLVEYELIKSGRAVKSIKLRVSTKTMLDRMRIAAEINKELSSNQLSFLESSDS